MAMAMARRSGGGERDEGRSNFKAEALRESYEVD